MGRQVDKRVAKVTLHTEPGPGEGVGSLRGSKGLGLGGGRCGGAREELAPTQRPQKAPSAVWRVAWSFPASASWVWCGWKQRVLGAVTERWEQRDQ